MIRGLAQLALATSVRFGTGVLTFVYAAKQWESVLFGQFMYSFSIATLFVIFCDFGFVQQILKDVGANPKRLSTKLNQFMAAKSWLIVLVVIAALTFSALPSSSSDGHAALLLLLVAAGCAGSVSEMLFQSMRAVGRYGDEMRISLWTNAIALMIFVVVLTLDCTPVQLAITFCIVRSIQLCIVGFASDLRWFSIVKYRTFLKFRHVLRTIKGGQAYAYEVMVTAALSNVDTIVLARHVDFSQIGIYQAAARLSQGVSIAFSVLAGYFLPKVARAHQQSNLESRLTIRMFSIVAIVGFALVLSFLAAAEYYGRQPADSSLFQAAPLLWGFAALVLIRFFSGSAAILLTATGRQSLRSLVYLGVLLIYIISASVMVPIMGVWGALIGYLVAYSILALGFAVCAPSNVRLHIVIAAIMVISLTATSFFFLTRIFLTK